MPTTEEILSAAEKLGKMIADHDAAKRFRTAVKSLEADTDAQKLLTEMNRKAQEMEQRMMSGQPVEVAEKQAMEALRAQVITNPTLGSFQMAQMDFVDLMRKVDEAMTAETEGKSAAGTSPDVGAGPVIMS